MLQWLFLHFVLIVKTSVERNSSVFSSFEDTPGLFFSSVVWESLRFLPSFIGHRVVALKCSQEIQTPGSVSFMLCFCTVSPHFLIWVFIKTFLQFKNIKC